jgi:benzodiazapine receptor
VPPGPSLTDPADTEIAHSDRIRTAHPGRAVGKLPEGQAEPVLRKILPVTSAAVATTAALGSLASSDVQSAWYAALDKPKFQPPGGVFPVVWTLLYSDIALTSAVAINRLRDRDPAALGRYRRALALNLALNASWSWVFFKAHRLGPAVWVAGALAASSIDLVRRTVGAERAAGVALSPYAGWCTFAKALSLSIWLRNRQRSPRR